MRKPNIKDILTVLIKHLERVLNRTALMIFMVAIVCMAVGAIVSYRYVIYPIKGEFPHKNGLIEIDTETYRKVREIWDERNIRAGQAEERTFKDPFFPVDADSIEEDLSIKDLSIEALENLLAQTLFEFYEMRGEGMPPISERALIWEELGLGTAQEYRGTYAQNILFLKTLKEIISNNQSVPPL